MHEPPQRLYMEVPLDVWILNSLEEPQVSFAFQFSYIYTTKVQHNARIITPHPPAEGCKGSLIYGCSFLFICVGLFFRMSVVKIQHTGDN